MTDHYAEQVRQQLAAARARSARLRAAWQSARRRATEYSAAVDHTVAAAERGVEDLGRIAHDQLTRAETAEARIAAVRALAAKLRATEAHGGRWDGLQQAADDIEAALDGASTSGVAE